MGVIDLKNLSNYASKGMPRYKISKKREADNSKMRYLWR
jgi:hypothetical protein